MTERMQSGGCSLGLVRSQEPRLLVSVRSPEEAAAAMAGGANIIDVKEPIRGSLGMAGVDVIEAIADQMESFQKTQKRLLPKDRSPDPIPLSVALGEVIEWRGQEDIPVLPSSVTLAKLGLSQLSHAADWRGEWREIRKRFDQQRLFPLRWVAVAYADTQSAGCPPISAVVEAAIATDCEGLLIDTYAKNGATLVDYCRASELRALADQCHAEGLFLALAGRLSSELLPALCGVPADVLAIRSAACENSARQGLVCVAAVASFYQSLQRHVTALRPAMTPVSSD